MVSTVSSPSERHVECTEHSENVSLLPGVVAHSALPFEAFPWRPDDFNSLWWSWGPSSLAGTKLDTALWGFALYGCLLFSPLQTHIWSSYRG